MIFFSVNIWEQRIKWPSRYHKPFHGGERSHSILGRKQKLIWADKTLKIPLAFYKDSWHRIGKNPPPDKSMVWVCGVVLWSALFYSADSAPQRLYKVLCTAHSLAHSFCLPGATFPITVWQSRLPHTDSMFLSHVCGRRIPRVSCRGVKVTLERAAACRVTPLSEVTVNQQAVSVTLIFSFSLG